MRLNVALKIHQKKKKKILYQKSSFESPFEVEVAAVFTIFFCLSLPDILWKVRRNRRRLFPEKKEQGGTTDSKKTFFDFAPFFPTLPLSSSFCWSREKDTKSALHRVSLRDRVSFLLLFLMAGWDMDERLMAGTGKEKTLSVLGRRLRLCHKNFNCRQP